MEPHMDKFNINSEFLAGAMIRGKGLPFCWPQKKARSHAPGGIINMNITPYRPSKFIHVYNIYIYSKLKQHQKIKPRNTLASQPVSTLPPAPETRRHAPAIPENGSTGPPGPEIRREAPLLLHVSTDQLGKRQTAHSEVMELMGLMRTS